jgi:hypothetical protein
MNEVLGELQAHLPSELRRLYVFSIPKRAAVAIVIGQDFQALSVDDSQCYGSPGHEALVAIG